MISEQALNNAAFANALDFLDALMYPYTFTIDRERKEPMPLMQNADGSLLLNNTLRLSKEQVEQVKNALPYERQEGWWLVTRGGLPSKYLGKTLRLVQGYSTMIEAADGSHVQAYEYSSGNNNGHFIVHWNR